MLYEHSVGQLYSPDRRSWPEITEYKYRSHTHELGMFLRNPSAQKVQDVRCGEAEFGVLVEGPVIFFLYRFGESLPWSDAPFIIHLLPEDERTIPKQEPSHENRALLHIFLVDAGTGIIKALRLISLSPELTRALNEAIRNQAAQRWPGREKFDQALDVAYKKYPRSDVMVRYATLGKGRDPFSP